MPIKRGFSYAVFEDNYRTLRAEGKPHDQALAISYKSVRESFWRRYPHGAAPAWACHGHPRLKPAKRAKNPLATTMLSAASAAHYLTSQAMKNPAPRATACGCATRKPNPVPPSKHVQARDAAELYKNFTGHDALDEVHIDKPELPDVMLVVGDIDGIMYTTVRDGVTEKYVHQFKKKARPLFCVSPDGTQIHLLGGEYDFTERGIVDRT